MSNCLPFFKNQLLSYLILALLFILSCQPAHSQENLPSRQLGSNGRLAVFLDAPWAMDFDFIREQIPIIVYVRDKDLADVHILLTRHDAGIAGTNYYISFFGRRAFRDINYDLNYWAPSSNTRDDTRRGYTNTIKAGLMPYLSLTTLTEKVSIEYKDVAPPSEEIHEFVPEKDPWNQWIFEIYGGGFFNKEETRQSFSSRFGFFADRITTDWKVRFRPYFNFSEVVFITTNDTITSTSHRHGYESYVVKSMGDHWSAGLFSSGLTSTFHNMNYSVDLAPAIEYSFYPYAEATRRSITFSYRLGYSYNNYLHTTIFMKDEESLVKQALEATAQFDQVWGNFRAGIVGSNHFHDFSVNRLEMFGNINFRIVRGLSMNAYINYNLINDLISIPAGDLSLEDILLMQKQRSTSYSVVGSIGLSYVFGSQVKGSFNPRLL